MRSQVSAMGKLDGKVAIVTGARQGIGAGIARVLGRHGACVVLTSSSSSVTITAQELARDGLRASAYRMDVTNTQQVDQVVKQVFDKFGSIDILVNNAGIYQRCELLETSDDFLQKTFDLNVFGMFRCARAVLPIMMKQRYGKIVNLSSVTGLLVADRTGGQTAYASTKAAVWGFTVALALEVAQYGINVNCVVPGDIDTPGLREQNPKGVEELGGTNPMRRIGTAEEVGDLVGFLVSDESKYLTGTHVVIDGGNIIQE